MSPPPRTKVWPLIALFIAINMLWAGWAWLTSVPKDVVEIAVAPVAHNHSVVVGQPTFTWRFNLDVVDEQALTKPPLIIPQITPAVAGQWTWHDRRTLAFTPASDLPLATTFTATLSEKDWQTASGFRMAKAHTCSWSTPALSLTDAAVETFGHDGTIVTLKFNQDVDPVVIANAVSVTLDQQTTTAEKPRDEMRATTPAAETAPAAEPVVIAEPTPQPSEPTEPVASAINKAEPLATKIRALSTTIGNTIRLLVSAPTRGPATLGLPAGTVGIAGPLGTSEAWSKSIDLQQTLMLTNAEVSVPSNGLVHIAVHVNNPAAPRDVLAPSIHIDPPVQMTLRTTETGVELLGDFVPGTSYRISTKATWPDDNATSGHVLAAYTAASTLTVDVPARPPGVWPLDTAVIDGQVRIAALAISRATVTLLDAEGDEALASSEITWTSDASAPDASAPAAISADTLSESLAPGKYRLAISAEHEPPTPSPIQWQRPIIVEHIQVRPQALLAALHTLGEAILSGKIDSDIPVRVVRFAE